MSPVLAFAISITMLMNGNAGEPRIVHHRIMPVESCKAWAKAQRAEPVRPVDPVSGRKVASRAFECALIRVDEIQAMIEGVGGR